MSSSSDFTISSDWDIIGDEMAQPTSDGQKTEEVTSGDLNDMPKGSCVDDLLQQEINASEDPNVGVPDVAGSETSNQHETSSEFDILDEAAEDNHSNISYIHMEYSLSSSLESSHHSLVPDLEVDADPIQEVRSQPRPPEYIGAKIHPYMVVVSLCFAFVAILFVSVPLDSIKQMKEHLSSLQTENAKLKNLVQSKMENDKILLGLEAQIKSLKVENLKLSDSMKYLVSELEEQTILLKKDMETKEQDPYRNEIEKLKEQINILQIDNEELQKQLVRTRYGIYSPHVKESKEDPSPEEIKDKTDNKDNRDNSSEILMEEINELRKKLYTEVEKLKNWKDSVQHLVKKLENTGSAFDNVEENFKNKKESSEKMKASKPGKKDKKFSDWSWGDVKKNLKDTFEGLQDIDVPNMISNYMDRKRIEGVFESVNHYFRKAQEKTKKVLNFNNDVNEEMWYFFGQLRNRWDDVKNKYFQKYYPAKQTSPKNENDKQRYQEDKIKPNRAGTQDFETNKKFGKYEKRNKPKEASNEKQDPHMYPDLDSYATSFFADTFGSTENKMAPENKDMNEDNSWVFRRAAHRSQLREEDEEAFTNWFLKRGRDFHYNEDESLKEWFKETYKNIKSDEE